MQTEQQIQQRSRMIGYLLVAVLIIVLTGYAYFFKGGEDAAARIAPQSNGTLTIAFSDGGIKTIVYADMLSAVYEESPDFGESAGGSIVNNIREGLWRNETWGEYTASCETKINACVVVRTAEKTYALNLESPAATRALCDALQKVMPQSEQSEETNP